MPYKTHEMNVLLFSKEDSIFADVEISQEQDNKDQDQSSTGGDQTKDFDW